MSTILQVKSLTKTYGSKGSTIAAQALKGIHLEVGTGEFVGVMGPSGSGKTTLLNMLAGIDKPSSGELLINGKDMTRLKTEQMAELRRTKLGFVFQDFNLLDTLTLAENVALPLLMGGQRGTEIQKRIDSLMSYLGIGGVQGRYPYEVSGGQQQRAAVARAIVHDPLLLLADEPTGNLDSASAKALLELFTQLNDERQTTVLMVTHDPFAASYCKRVIFIKDGLVYSQLQRNGGRQQFFQRILDTLSVLEGSSR